MYHHSIILYIEPWHGNRLCKNFNAVAFICTVLQPLFLARSFKVCMMVASIELYLLIPNNYGDLGMISHSHSNIGKVKLQVVCSWFGLPNGLQTCVIVTCIVCGQDEAYSAFWWLWQELYLREIIGTFSFTDCKKPDHWLFSKSI